MGNFTVSLINHTVCVLTEIATPDLGDVDGMADVGPVAAGRGGRDITVEALVVLEAVLCEQGCQMAKFDPFLSLDCAGTEGVGAQSKERKGSNFAVQRSRAIVLQARRAICHLATMWN